MIEAGCRERPARLMPSRAAALLRERMAVETPVLVLSEQVQHRGRRIVARAGSSFLCIETGRLDHRAADTPRESLPGGAAIGMDCPGLGTAYRVPGRHTLLERLMCDRRDGGGACVATIAMLVRSIADSMMAWHAASRGGRHHSRADGDGDTGGPAWFMPDQRLAADGVSPSLASTMRHAAAVLDRFDAYGGIAAQGGLDDIFVAEDLGEARWLLTQAVRPGTHHVLSIFAETVEVLLSMTADEVERRPLTGLAIDFSARFHLSTDELAGFVAAHIMAHGSSYAALYPGNRHAIMVQQARIAEQAIMTCTS